ncbi:hypothetical protein GE061_009640 [Apolygus lucorum]|uniref:Regulatory protein zeste n=1 Tax=Apolygus lucorum TaxID=248454 RepID=A0A8S9Y4W7_APOLU|nr:hypothetical protein GE061_009640 [Apolygus lucorum]
MERKNKIENKESDAVSLQEKRRAWDEVAQEFNNVPTHTKRTVAQLMKWRGEAVAEEVAARSRLNEQKMANEEELH